MTTTEPRKRHPEQAAPDIDVLLTAREAYPALERAVLAAKSQITAGFRLFDPRTDLMSEAARATGARWLDLIVDALNRGVSVTLTLSDFDPVMAHRLHQRSWDHLRVWLAANELSRPGAARLTVKNFAHPARGGILPQVIFSFRTRKTLRGIVADFPSDPAQLRKILETSPGLRSLINIREGPNGEAPRMHRFALPELRPVTLHHKLAVIDHKLTYIGGLDLNERRFDDPSHERAAQSTWHDLQLMVRDPDVAADAERYLTDLPAVTHGHQAMPRAASRFLCTLSQARPRPFVALRPRRHRTDILQTTLEAIAEAREFIYIETQYFRDRRIAQALADAGAKHANLRLLVVVPAAPEDVAFAPGATLDARFGEYLQVRAMRKVRKAFGERFLAASPAQPRPVGGADAKGARATLGGAPIVYVHSKVAIFDDARAIVASANLNGRSLSWDAEAGIDIVQPEPVGRLKRRILSHWLGETFTGGLPPAPALFAAVRDRAKANARAAPNDRIGFLLPYRLDRASDSAQPLPGAPEEMV